MGDIAVCACAGGPCLGAVGEKRDMMPHQNALYNQSVLPCASETRECQRKEENNAEAMDLICQIEELLDKVVECPCGSLCEGVIEEPKPEEDTAIFAKLQYPSREIFVDRNRLKCQYCQRRFPIEKLDYHEKICFKFHKKRKDVVPYNATKHRLDNLSKTNRKRARKAERPPKLTEVDWKQEHEEWSKLMTSDITVKKETLFKDVRLKRIQLRECKTSEYLREKGIISCPI